MDQRVLDKDFFRITYQNVCLLCPPPLSTLPIICSFLSLSLLQLDASPVAKKFEFPSSNSRNPQPPFTRSLFLLLAVNLHVESEFLRVNHEYLSMMSKPKYQLYNNALACLLGAHADWLFL